MARNFVVDLDTRVLDSIIANNPQRAEGIIRKLAQQVEAETKNSMVDEGTGRTYVRGGIAHTASAPGQPPAVDTGNLKNSIQTNRVSQREYRVNVGAEYGIYLELGTSRMAARPFLTPAVERVAKYMRAYWDQLI